jgi:hypothetical protein
VDGAGSTFSLSKLGLGKSGAVENFLTGATETAGPLNFLKTIFPDLDFLLWILIPQIRRYMFKDLDPDPNLDNRSLKKC